MSDRTNALRIEERADGVAVVWMDVPGDSVNTLKEDFADEFAEAFSHLERTDTVKAVVFASAKNDSFIAGANIDMLDSVQRAEDAVALSRAGQAANDRIASFPKPIVAAIHGACLGGGLEVALACHGRVASSHRKTKLGLPECQLGLLPGAGGTQRLPRLIGVQAALDLLLTGKQVDARKAQKLGLVDEVVAPAIVVDVAIEHAKKRIGRAADAAPKLLDRLADTEALAELALTKNPLGRKVLFDQARKKLHEKTRGNYPAQERILDVVKVGLEDGMEAGLDAEAEAFGALVMSPESRALRSIFFATQELKKDSGVDDPEVQPKDVRHVGILGAGLMGAGIAYVTTTRAKTPVRLKDRDADGVLAGLRYVRDIHDGRVRRRRLTPMEADRLMMMTLGTRDYSGFHRCELVVEAVFEDLDLKQRMVRDVEAVGPQDVIFASNTSSLPITEIARASAHPETVIGMHYFSPVHKMPLLEVVVTDQTADWVTATCVALGKRQGKTVIVVKDGPGFYTTRILAPMMNEAAHILAEGVPVEAIDEAMLDFGFPIGPLKLTDEVGIDVGAKVGEVLREAFGERLSPPAGMERLIASGRKGRKNGRGFYRYDGKDRGVDETVYADLGIEPHQTLPAEEIAWRCTLQMVNEAALCFGEGILRSARDGDIGAIFGLGFPPFRGGPFRFVDSVGARTIVRRLRGYEARFGPRFRPAPVLVAMAESERTFHGAAPIAPGSLRTGSG